MPNFARKAEERLKQYKNRMFSGCVANYEVQLTNMRDLTFVPVE